MGRVKTQARKAGSLYSEKEKIKAVTAMRAVGQEHMQSERAMEAARQILGADVPRATLARWAVKYAALVDKLKPALNPALLDRSALVASTQEQVVNGFMEIRDRAISRLKEPDVLGTASARDTAVVLGISQQHLNVLTALPAEAQKAALRLYRLCEQHNDDFIALVDDICTTYLAQHNGIAIKAESE